MLTKFKQKKSATITVVYWSLIDDNHGAEFASLHNILYY